MNVSNDTLFGGNNMRNVDRIDPFLEEIGSLWKKNFPDWRFGQLMYNFFCELGDPFYYEEEEFLVGFRAYCNRENPKEAIKNFQEQSRDKEAEQKYLDELNDFFKVFQTEEFQKKLKAKVDEINMRIEASGDDVDWDALLDSDE